MATKHIGDAEGEFFVMSVAPDVCLVGKKPIPFDIFQVLTPEKSDYAKTVFARGNPVLMQNSVVRAVIGDTGEGVASTVSQGAGHSKIITGAPTVFAEGRPVSRHMDDVLMNGND